MPWAYGGLEGSGARAPPGAPARPQVARSEKLARLLEHVLALGNRLNGGTPRGGARGFALEALPKLGAVRGAKGESLLHFLADHLRARGEDALVDAADDVPDLAAAASAGAATWRADVRRPSFC